MVTSRVLYYEEGSEREQGRPTQTPTGTGRLLCHTNPSFSIALTSFSIAAMSVSSPHDLTWSVTTDLTPSSISPDASFSAVLAALASWYFPTRSALSRSASASSSSSSPFIKVVDDRQLPRPRRRARQLRPCRVWRRTRRTA